MHVSLTDAGRDLVDTILAGLMQREEHLLDPLAPGQRRHLQELLRGWLLWLEHNDSN